MKTTTKADRVATLQAAEVDFYGLPGRPYSCAPDRGNALRRLWAARKALETCDLYARIAAGGDC